MVDFPYTPTPGKIKDYFSKIQEVGVPTKVNREYLKTIGFKSSNDFYLLGILKFIGFIDASNVPTDNWKKYREKAEAKKVMATVLRSSYGELFNVYADAFRRDKGTLLDFFRSKTTVAGTTIDLMVRTFSGLCDLADFEAVEIPTEEKGKEEKKEEEEKKEYPLPGLVINLNIQLALPATEDASVYDKIFESLRKHLLIRD